MIELIKNLFTTKKRTINSSNISTLVLEIVNDIKQNPDRIKPYGWNGTHKYNIYLFKDSISNFKFSVDVLPKFKEGKIIKGVYIYKFFCEEFDLNEKEQCYIMSTLGTLVEDFLIKVNNGVLYNNKEDKVLSSWRGDGL